MYNWKRIEALLGETLREIGILVLVFAPLDAAFTEQPIDAKDLAGIALAAIGLIVMGILLEAEE